MKANIIGGGVAGLYSAIALRSVGIEATVYERSESYRPVGLGFLLLANGLRALRAQGLESKVRNAGTVIKNVIIRDTLGSVMLRESLDNCLGIPRYKLIQILREALPPEAIVCGMKLEKFGAGIFGKPEISFKNQISLQSDLLLAADGVGSEIRAQLFPDHQTRSSGMKEIVCMTQIPHLSAKLDRTFIKTQKLGGGLAMGILPAGNGMVIWFLQFDADKYPAPERNPRAIRTFVNRLVGNWAPPISEVLLLSNFAGAHIWDVKQMDILPSFFNRRIVMLGDAAHPLLSLTSQGANSAMQDGLVLAQCLLQAKEDFSQIPASLLEFNNKRRPVINGYIEKGNRLLHQFLNPSLSQEGAVNVPLAGKYAK